MKNVKIFSNPDFLQTEDGDITDRPLFKLHSAKIIKREKNDYLKKNSTFSKIKTLLNLDRKKQFSVKKKKLEKVFAKKKINLDIEKNEEIIEYTNTKEIFLDKNLISGVFLGFFLNFLSVFFILKNNHKKFKKGLKIGLFFFYTLFFLSFLCYLFFKTSFFVYTPKIVIKKYSHS